MTFVIRSAAILYLVIFGSLIDDKDVLSSFYSVSLSLTAGLVDVDRAVIDIARNEGLYKVFTITRPLREIAWLMQAAIIIRDEH